MEWELVVLADLLPRALYQYLWNVGCCSWRSFPVPYTYSSYQPCGKDGVESSLEQGTSTPQERKRNHYLKNWLW
jgi:hypothetical protein